MFPGLQIFRTREKSSSYLSIENGASPNNPNSPSALENGGTSIHSASPTDPSSASPTSPFSIMKFNEKTTTKTSCADITAMIQAKIGNKGAKDGESDEDDEEGEEPPKKNDGKVFKRPASKKISHEGHEGEKGKDW